MANSTGSLLEDNREVLLRSFNGSNIVSSLQPCDSTPGSLPKWGKKGLSVQNIYTCIQNTICNHQNQRKHQMPCHWAIDMEVVLISYNRLRNKRIRTCNNVMNHEHVVLSRNLLLKTDLEGMAPTYNLAIQVAGQENDKFKTGMDYIRDTRQTELCKVTMS